MSRVIVKNLPQKCSEEKLKELFSCCGEITDVRLVRTREGTSRKFGFIGFNSAPHAGDALKRFNKTYIGASRIEVDLAKPYGDQSLERPWSKYSNRSSQLTGGCGREVKGHEQEETEAGKGMREYEALGEDPDFQEFLDVHRNAGKAKTWSNNAESAKGHGKSDTPIEMNDVEGGDDVSRGDTSIPHHTSDLDYLKTKVVGSSQSSAAADGELPASGDDQGDDAADSAAASAQVGDRQTEATTPYTVKMLGLPFRAVEDHVHTFFHPLKVVALRFTKDPEGRPSGRAYADFQSEGDLKEALKRNKDCIFHRYIELFRDEVRTEQVQSAPGPGAKLKPWEVKAALGEREAGGEDDEGITESGRIFVRNLPFSTLEEELRQLFGEYGPLTEVAIPLDKTTNKSTGLAFVTYMLPEHAVKAFQALDGQIFQGRLLHLLAARARRSHTDKHPAQISSFKKAAASKTRSAAGSSHNWNALFLGTNAVVDVMAGKYSADKSAILDPSSAGTSAAVRVALGETQIVRETREFLQRQGVNLDLFEQKVSKRSQTVILVKNLPSGTVSSDIVKLFDPFGQLLQVILPPAAITAMVEFAEASHARKAFSKLAYTSFKHLPLYLEWAPLNVLDTPPDGVKNASSLECASEPGEEGDTCSVFVKNLSFSTGEVELRRLFSRVGGVKSASIARKRNPKDPATPLSMGYGFVEYESQASAAEAVKQLQHSNLEGHTLELKISHHRTKVQSPHAARKGVAATKQKSAKILVRNIPFEATRRELKELFSTFGTLKMVRLPKKMSADGSGAHRGFGFVEFATKEDAKSAFDALRHSTHLYGRRLVLEWAEQEESLEAIRKRTAEHFHGFKEHNSKKTKSQELTLITTLEKSAAA